MRNTKSSSHSKASKSKGSVLRHVQNFSLAQLLIFIVIFSAIGGYIIYKSLAAPPRFPSTMSWNPYFENILTGMDTPEPPDGHHPNNTTGCAWNDEDQMERLGSGSVTGSTSDTMCLVADLAGGSSVYPKSVIYKIYSPTDTLSVSLSNDAGNSWNSPPAIKSGNQYLYQLCIMDPVGANAPVFGTDQLTYWPIIPNTNNGYGKIVNYTIKLTSLKNTTHKISADWAVGLNGNWRGGNMEDIQQSSPVPCSS